MRRQYYDCSLVVFQVGKGKCVSPASKESQTSGRCYGEYDWHFNHLKTNAFLRAQYTRVRTGLKSTWIYRTVLKSPWKLNLPWKVLESTQRPWKVLEFNHLQEDSTLFLETEISIKKLWCLYLVKHMLHQIKAPQFYTNHLLKLISLVMDSSISEEEF